MAAQPTAPDERGDWVLHASGARTALVGACCAIGVGFGVLLMWDGLVSAQPSTVATLVGALLVLVSAGAGIWLIRAYLRRDPLLRITREGITDCSPFTGVGLLRWEEIDHLRPYYFKGHGMLGIVATDPVAIRQRVGRAKRIALRANRLLGCPEINIPATAMPSSVEAFADTLAQHYGVRIDSP